MSTGLSPWQWRKKLKSIQVKLWVNIDEGRIELYWDTKGIDGTVMVYRKTVGTEYRLIGTVEGMAEKYYDRIVKNGENYFYKLVFHNYNKKHKSVYINISYK